MYVFCILLVFAPDREVAWQMWRAHNSEPKVLEMLDAMLYDTIVMEGNSRWRVLVRELPC